MSFILPSQPSERADIHELADFIELECLANGNVSVREVVAHLGRVSDNDYNDGCDDDADDAADLVGDAMDEIAQRKIYCESGYPFKLGRAGETLKSSYKPTNVRSVVYCYLLLSTRINMGTKGTHANINGTDLLEELSAHVLRNYLGPTRAKSLVFGTSLATGAFSDRVTELCNQLKEGNKFRDTFNVGAAQKKDGKLDSVAWIPFSDFLPGQLIIFAQCKTGTSWQGEGAKLKPVDFIKNWMDCSFIVDPLRAFCVSEAPSRRKRPEISVDAGILIDRCRIVDFSDKLDGDLFGRMQKWVKAALEYAAKCREAVAR